MKWFNRINCRWNNTNDTKQNRRKRDGKEEMKKKREKKIQPKMSSSTNESNWGNYKRDFQMVIIILCYNSTTQGIQTQAIITLFDSQFTSNLDPWTQQASINFSIQIVKPKLKPRLDVMWCGVQTYTKHHHIITSSHHHIITLALLQNFQLNDCFTKGQTYCCDLSW